MSNYPAKYTIVLGELLGNNFEVFPEAFMQTVNIPEVFKTEFIQRFKSRFFFREIGFETPQLFAKHCQNHLFYLSSIYNKLLTPALNDIDFYNNYVQEVKTTGTITGTLERTGETTGTNKTAFSDTPQGRTSVLNSGFYSNLQDGENASENSESGTNTTEQDTTVLTTGNINATKWEQYVNYRDTYKDIVDDLINHFTGMFMLVY